MMMVFMQILLVLNGCSLTPEYFAPEIRTEYYGVSGSSATPIPDAMEYASSARALSDETPIGLNDPLTLTRVIDISIANNPNLQQAVHRIAQAKAMKDLSSAAFWPIIGFYTEYMQGDAPSAYLFKTIDQRRLPQNIDFNDPDWFENYETGITARMNLFNGGRDYLGYRIAEQNAHISGLERQTVVNALIAQVIAGFYDVLSAREFIRISEASVASVSEQLRIIQVHYEGGAALKADVLTLKVRRAQEQELLIESRNRYKMAHLALLGVTRDVRNAYLNLEAARARYDVAASSIQNAEESYRLVKEYFNRGTVTITRYLEAEVTYNRARIRSTAAFYDKIKANAEIARAIGKLADGKQRNPER